MDIREPMAPTSTQRPLDGGVVVLLLSYPVSLSAAAAASVWTWLAVAVAGVWLWRVIAHQSSATGARVKGLQAVTPQTEVGHLLPIDTSTDASFQHRQRPVPSTSTILPYSPREEDVAEITMEMRSACGGPSLLSPLQEPTFCAGGKTVDAYFEGHGGYCRGSHPIDEVDQQEEEEEQVPPPPQHSSHWTWEVQGKAMDLPSDHDGCRSKVVLCWEDGVQQEEITDDRPDTSTAALIVRTHDLGWYRFQDWGAINGSVVRLWETNSNGALQPFLPAAAGRSRPGRHGLVPGVPSCRG